MLVQTHSCSHTEREFSNTNIFTIHYINNHLLIKYFLSIYGVPGHEVDAGGGYIEELVIKSPLSVL